MYSNKTARVTSKCHNLQNDGSTQQEALVPCWQTAQLLHRTMGGWRVQPSSNNTPNFLCAHGLQVGSFLAALRHFPWALGQKKGSKGSTSDKKTVVWTSEFKVCSDRVRAKYVDLYIKDQQKYNSAFLCLRHQGNEDRKEERKLQLTWWWILQIKPKTFW